MREVHNASCSSGKFDSYTYRRLICADPNFVYGHYQIGPSVVSTGNMFRTTNPQKGFATIGGVRIGQKLYYAVSLCSPLDNFSKKVGREKVCANMRDHLSSRQRGVFDISGMEDEQPAIILKCALEHYLEVTRHLPPWTRQVVLFRGVPRRRETTSQQQAHIPPVIRAFFQTDSSQQMKRRNAALKAWETRRKKGQD